MDYTKNERIHRVERARLEVEIQATRVREAKKNLEEGYKKLQAEMEKEYAKLKFDVEREEFRLRQEQAYLKLAQSELDQNFEL